MDSQSLKEELDRLHAQNQEMKHIMQQLLRENLERMQYTGSQTCFPACCHHQLLHPHLHPHLVPVMLPGHNPTMLCGSLQPLRAGVASGQHELLPPITPARAQQQQSSGSFPSLPALAQGQDPVQLWLGDSRLSAIPQGGAPRPLGRRNLTGLDRAHPLMPLHHDRAPSGVANGSMAPAPPVIAKATGESQNNEPKKIKARRCIKTVQDVGLKTSSHQNMGCVLEPLNVHQIPENLQLEALRVAEEIRLTSLRCNSVLSGNASASDRAGSSTSSLSPVDLRTPSALRALPFLNTPTPPIAHAVPSPPETAKPQTTNQRRFVSRLPRLKKTASVSVATAVTEQKSVECLAGKEEVRECKEVKKKRVIEKQTSNTQQIRELPELAKLPPVSCPEEAILQAFRLLREDDWQQKIEALISIRSLSQHHAEVLLPRLHDVCLAVYHEVKNLRSMVSRAAMVTLAHLHAHLGRGMDTEAEGTAQTLLPKAGEASGFIREDMELALGYMVLNVTPSRSMNALINTGLRHRNAAVRKTTAQFLERLAEVMGASRVLSGKKNLTDRFIHSISCLALDSAQEVRTHARNTLAFLASHPDLIKMVDRFAPQRDQGTVRDVINKCQKNR
ncbi:TOG array regulator of axonemal microtubules protein 2-like isoform X2 [Alosa sapidissima]|uniref:TOG array regulator of axonemal microtubules protein 2-like isoform X2 n=1 Tax=Alosa sapidissima TaxID=34773 RepID=UPI001C09F7A7|nr:TOG array regulator of axonemal microtubules protein 2-like isoform X2 [Alosa sapidissima]